MTFSIIQKSELEGANRLDAEYYQPEYLRVNKILSGLQSIRLREIITRPVVTGSTPKIRDPKMDGTDIKFIKTDVLRDGDINFDSADFLPLKVNKKNSEPQNGDIILTIIGATYKIVGRSARIFAGDPKMNINQNIALIRPRSLILPGYLETFLRTKFGRDQLWQQSRQTEQVNLNCREVENILVPVLTSEFQQEIDDLVNQAQILKGNSHRLFGEAEELLLEELGLKDFKPREDLSFVVDYSDVEKAKRIDADYFQPKYEDLINKLKTSKPRLLTAVIESVAAQFSPKNEENYKYVELANINSSIGIIDGYSRILGKEAPSRARRILREGDVIVSSVEGSLEKVALASMGQSNFLASTGFFQFRSKFILPEVLLVIAKSLVLQMQLKKHCSGTILMAVPNDSLKNILIPVLPKVTQQKIAALVRKSYEAKKKSKELLEEAKIKVEMMIEKEGEKNGSKN